MSDSEISHQQSCMDNSQAGILSVAEAVAAIRKAISPLSDFETLPIKDSFQRVLARDIIAPLNIPAKNNSAMDGYAVNSTDLTTKGTTKLKIIGTAFAGNPYQGTVNTGECIRIMTGAVIPNGTDTVIIQEHTERQDNFIVTDATAEMGANVRQAGEDIVAGKILLKKGRRITAADIGLIASSGIAKVDVIKRPRIAFFSTGDELCSIGDEPKEGEIYDSNRYTLFGMLSELNVSLIDMGIIADKKELLQQAFEDAASNADMIITTGGVSVGDADFVKDILQKIGTVNFWKIAIKPGRPLAFGKIGTTLFFGLPGNPVSVMVTFYQFVRPSIRRLMAEEYSNAITMQAPCISNLKKRPGRVEYQRGILEHNDQQQWVVKKTDHQGSGILTSMSQANCFIILPAASTAITAGTIVEVQPFTNFI